MTVMITRIRGFAMVEINVKGFSGANNVKTDERFYSKSEIAEPRVILNADVDFTGKLTIRKGFILFINLPRVHSLWANQNCMLCVADGVLYRNIQGVAVNVGSVSGPKYPLSYEEVDDKIYMSNPYWQGILDPSTNTVLPWGISLPPGPMLLLGNGNLPAGTYHICFTNVVGSEISGNGPITTISLASDGGIQILNRPSGALVWITDSDEYIFYLVGAISQVSDIPTIEPLLSFMCSPPPYMENICYAFGRIWGSVNSDLYYCEPYRFGWFKLSGNIFSFDSNITLIAKTNTGLFIGMEEKTIFLSGTEPDQMQEINAGSGSVKGTLTYCNNLPDLGSVLGTPEKGFVNVPVWMTEEGIVAGNSTGKLYNLTKNKIKTSKPSRGASLYRNFEGVFQFLVNFKRGIIGSGKGFSDPCTDEAFTNEKISLYDKKTGIMSSNTGFKDSATCTVTRGGVEV